MATNASRIWRFFLNAFNGNEYGVAGLMGNLRAESGLIPNNVENGYEDDLGMGDEEYTAAVDSGEYSQSKFENDRVGYGLAQWTHPSRKPKLYKFWKEYHKTVSIGDLEMQCNFLLKELKDDYQSVYNTLLNATSIAEASDKVLYDFESPVIGENTVAYRRRLCQGYYDDFTGTYGDPFEGEAVVRKSMSKLLLYAAAIDLI